ncbi:MAG TPA: HEAT repeat domain-containing protein, partial [Pirellulaceae bacterium]|nr:HEAT repeat domain-containing protein [Pirellulaceae bacterium]
MTQSDPVVRIAVLDAFAEIADPTANAAALAQLKDPAWQVRVAAVGALGRIRQKESVQPLIDQLRAESGRLRDDVKKALISITTSDLGDNADKWQEYWDKWKDRFKVPSDEEVRKAREAFEATQARYNPGADDFAGVPTKSKRIVYVIDISGSMEDPILNKEKFKLQ